MGFENPCQDVKSQNAPPLTPKKCWRQLSPGILAFGSNAKQRDTETLPQWSCTIRSVDRVTNNATAPMERQLCSLLDQRLNLPSGCPPPRGGFGRLLLLCSPVISSTRVTSPYHLQRNNATRRAPCPFRPVN